MNWLGILKRAGRTIVAVAVAGIATKYDNDPKWMALAPAISTVGKAIRSKWGWSWLPF